jgi:hypothetical protein
MTEAYVVTQNPSDYPGKFVVRHWLFCEDGRALVRRAPECVVDTLVQARQSIPPGYFLSAFEEEEKVIVEVWTSVKLTQDVTS